MVREEDAKYPDKYWYDIWNNEHCKHIQKGSKFRNRKMIKLLEKIIKQAKNDYYDGEPLMSDNLFDRWENGLKILDPNNPLIEKVGKNL